MPDRVALAFAALTSVMWGLTGIFVRLLPPISPVAITAGRLLIALVVVLPAVFVFPRLRQGLRASLANPLAWRLSLLLAVYYLLATSAFQLAPVAEVALLVATPPLFVLLFRRLGGDRPARGELIGALIALAGIGVIMLPRLSQGAGASTHHLSGDLLALAAAAATAWYAFSYRRVAVSGAAPDIGGVMLLTLIAGGGILALLALLSGGAAGLAQVDGKAFAAFIGLGIFSTAIPTGAFAIASKRLPPTLTATVALFIPLFSAIFAALILDEPLTGALLAGAVVILSGVGLIIRSGARV